MIRGVILDMDGLITDTERLFLRFWSEVMASRGYPAHEELVAHCVGLGIPEAEAYVRSKLGKSFDYRSILAEASALSREYCSRNGVPLKDGLSELLSFLEQKQIPYGVATSAGYESAKKRLTQIGLRDRLHGIVTGDMVRQGKPAPDIFLKACEQLGTPPGETLVLEDSPHGILGAYRAGCIPVMVPDLASPDAATTAIAYAVVPGLEQVIPLIRQINQY